MSAYQATSLLFISELRSYSTKTKAERGRGTEHVFCHSPETTTNKRARINGEIKGKNELLEGRVALRRSWLAGPGFASSMAISRRSRYYVVCGLRVDHCLINYSLDRAYRLASYGAAT